MPQDDQITSLVNQVTDILGPDTDVEADRLQVAIPSILTTTTTREQEDRLQEFVEQRLATTADELGRDEVLGMSEGNSAANFGIGVDNMLKQQNVGVSFFAKRRLHELNYNLKVEWREWVYGGIFAETNYPVPMSRRLVQQQISRAQNYFFATDPWFTAGPEGRSDEAIAREVDRFAKYKGRKARVKSTLCEAIQQGFIRGEGILKTSFADDQDIYETIAAVAVNPDGSLIQAMDGDYIYEDDQWVPVQAEIDPMADPMAPMMPAGYVLARDQQTPKPLGNLVFVRQKIKKAVSLRRGANLDIVHFLDFLCPINATNVQEADFVAHLYERPALHVAQQVLSQSDPANRSQILTLLRELAGAKPQAETAQLMTRPEIGENADRGLDGRNPGEPRVKLAECYVRFDLNQDGIEESLFVLLNMETGKLLYYDYLANITPDGKRPFHIVRVNPVDNRWYGLSQMEVFEDQQKLVDLFLNRVVKATSDQATIKFWHPERTKEGEADPDLQYNDGSVYTPKDNWKAEQILETVTIYEPRIEDLMRVVEFVQQNTLNLSGVAGANDANAAGLDTAKLATGIRNIDKTGQELFGPYLQALDDGLTSAVQSWIALELFYMDAREVYEYFEGDTRIVAELTKEKVRHLAVDVRLELTRYRNEQQDLQMMQSIQLVQQYFALPFILQTQLAPLFRQLLKLREIQDADMIIQPVDPMMSGMMPGTGMQGGAAPAIPPAQPPSPDKPITPTGPSQPGAAPPNV